MLSPKSSQEEVKTTVDISNNGRPSAQLNDSLQEIFAAFIGAVLAFTFIDFSFLNITGGCLSLFGLLSALWCLTDRKQGTYCLNLCLQLLAAILLTIAVARPFPGFEIYLDDPVLRNISIAHAPVAFAFAILSGYMAWRAHSTKTERMECNEGDVSASGLAAVANHGFNGGDDIDNNTRIRQVQKHQ